jgi:hypothetical protein
MTIIIFLLLIHNTFGLMNWELYDTINCNIIDKLNGHDIYTNDYKLIYKNNTYNMIEITNNNIYSVNKMYCTEKEQFTLYLNCANYTIFTIYSSKYVINNMIMNIEHLEHKLQYTLYTTNPNILCYSELIIDEFNAFKILILLCIFINMFCT